MEDKFNYKENNNSLSSILLPVGLFGFLVGAIFVNVREINY
jgi:hypothetical protein